MPRSANHRSSPVVASTSQAVARFAIVPVDRRSVGNVIWALGCPLLFLLALTLLFRLTDADVAISGLFYGTAEEAWAWQHAEPWLTLYHYGPLPGLVLGLSGAAVVILGLFWARLRSWREMGLFLTLLSAIGPGLAVNGIFKPLWMRPRPQQIDVFGGEQAFVNVWSFGTSRSSKSFPSGHASMGFVLMGPAFLLFRRRRNWALLFLLLGLSAGGILGLARIAQGQHFFSDVLWSGGMVYLTGVILGYLFHLASDARSRDGSATTRPVILSLDGPPSSQAPSDESDDIGRRTAA